VFGHGEYPEVKQKTDWFVREPEIAQDLSLVGICEGLDHFQFYDHQIIHQKIKTKSLGDQKTTIGQAKFDLVFNSMSRQPKFMG